jgi:hypothetical protein
VAILPDDVLSAVPGAGRIVEVSDVTRTHIEAKRDRRIEDAVHLADLDLATRVIFQKRPDEHPRLILEMDSAKDPDATDADLRLALRVYIVIKKAGNFVATWHRVRDTDWNRLRGQVTSTVLKE